jgi:ssRNA-specific RNase YbeY (16S rRNA maturation enzyme)
MKIVMVSQQRNNDIEAEFLVKNKATDVRHIFRLDTSN